MIIYTCPECGADLLASVIYTYPPINCMDCPSCGWHWESEPEPTEQCAIWIEEKEALKDGKDD